MNFVWASDCEYNSIANVRIGIRWRDSATDIVGERESEEMVGECLSSEELEAGSHR